MKEILKISQVIIGSVKTMVAPQPNFEGSVFCQIQLFASNDLQNIREDDYHFFLERTLRKYFVSDFISYSRTQNTQIIHKNQSLHELF